MRIEWLPVAARHRENQLAYIGERNPQAAIRMGDAIEASLLNLADHPYPGHTGRVEGSRELIVSQTPFVIVYRIEADAVVILRFLHGSQHWPIES